MQNNYYIYCISNNQNGYKIGVSKDVEARCKQLQTGNPNKLYVVGKIKALSRKDAFYVEKLLHIFFRELKSESKMEWFIIDKSLSDRFLSIFNYPDQDRLLNYSAEVSSFIKAGMFNLRGNSEGVIYNTYVTEEYLDREYLQTM